jgi:hypothetical protein
MKYVDKLKEKYNLLNNILSPQPNNYNHPNEKSQGVV